MESAYPPHLRGKSKEEKKAWEEREKRKFERESEKERAEMRFHSRLNKYDKLSREEQDSILDEVKSRLGAFEKKKKLNHDETKEYDGLKDFYLTADRERAFKDAKKEIEEKGAVDWVRNNHTSEKFDKVIDHINSSQAKILDNWWDARDKARLEDGSWDKLQTEYAQKLAKALGLPQDKETYYFLTDWFINGDD